nr:GNAT family N-acetyltransferase [Rhodococcus sp. HNM0569]
MIRDAHAAADAAACAALYRPYVIDTAITFESEPPGTDAMAARISAATRDYAWLVAENPGTPEGSAGERYGADILGYAYAGRFRERPAYRFTCEVSVYVRRGLRRTGAGRALYEALFTRLAERGYLTAVAVITVPNDASVGLHTALGFEPVGTFRRVGFKHGQWRDVEWMQRPLGTGPVAGPREPR